MTVERALSVAVLASIVILLLLPTSLVLAPAAHAPAAGKAIPAAEPPSTAASRAEARIASIESSLRARGVPAQDIHLPDIRGADPGRVGIVSPTYAQAPAPMGVADLGLSNRSGTTVASVLDTTQVQGTAALTSADSVYLDGDGPNMFGVQMNAVATNVTLFGAAKYEFWAQDFFSYTPDNGTLTFGDNLWNLSGPSGLLTANSIYSHGSSGVVVAPIYYYATGPTFVVHYPFSVTFALASGLVDNRPAIYFNYTVSAGTSTTSGSFDRIVFNSAKIIPILPAKVPVFQANGTGNDPYGLPNDLELVLVGDGDGDTTSFVALNAQFTLSTWNKTAKELQPVPAAYDAGSDTGETSDGVGVYFNATGPGAPIRTAVLEIGPSYLHGLWGLSHNAGYRTLSATVTPLNAFLFVTPGTEYNGSIAQWAPTLAFAGGTATISFPNTGEYYFEWMLSDYRPIHRALNPASNATAKVTATMARANSLGVYTPLVAWGDAQLPFISSSGAGTAASPYKIEANQYDPILPVFGAFNDFLFPVFPGILIVNSNDFVDVTPSSLEIAYSTSVAANLTRVGLPDTNDLQIEFWNVTNLTLEGASAISGWLSYNVGFSPLGAVILWGSTGDLVASNTFYDQGIALALYGGTANTVWGNSFLNSSAPATNLSAVENSGGNTTGIWESESGDLIYNNYFSLPAPAYTPTIDPVSCEIVCEPGRYADTWNVSDRPATDVRAVLGMNLTGSIIGTTYQGGNYWSNYGTPANPLGRLPYNDGGRITVGGDYVPLIRTPVFPVTIDEHGLATGTVWGVTVAGTLTETNATVLTLYEPNGTYVFGVLVPVGYAAAATGSFTVEGPGAGATVVFAPLVALTFAETGLFAGWSWNVTLVAVNGTTNETVNSTNLSITFEVVPGVYTFVANATGYTGVPANGTVTVGNASLAGPTVVFSLTPILSFSESGLAPGTAWTVEIVSGKSYANYTTFAEGLVLTIFDLPDAAFTWTATAANYTVSPGTGSGSPGAVADYDLKFTIVDGTISGSVNVAGAFVYIDGSLVTLSGKSFAQAETPGVHSIVVEAPGYVTYYNNVTVKSGATSSLSIGLTAVPPAPASTGPAGVSDLGWALIAMLAVLAALGLALAARSSRRKNPPPPVAPYAAAPPPASPALAVPRPPWLEDAEEGSEPAPGAPPKS